MSDRAVQDVFIKKFTRREQPRKKYDQEYLAGLAQSIKEHGVLQPVLAHREGGAFVLDDGHCRLLAAEMAGLETVPAIIDPRELTPAEVTQRQLVSNCQRSDLSPMETAAAIERLLAETKWSQAEIARKLGFSQGKVSRLLALLDLPEDIQAQVVAGSGPGISASAAYHIARSGDAAAQESLAADVAQNGLTRDDLAGKLKGRKQTNGGDARPAGRVTCALGGGRAVMVSGAALATLADLIQWLEELLAKARKERKARGQTLDLATFCSLLRHEAKSAKSNKADRPMDDGEAGAAVAVRA